MASTSKQLGLIVTIALGIAYAGCGAQQPVGQDAFPQAQDGMAASTPLPANEGSHDPSGPSLSLKGRTGQGLLYVDNGPAVDIFPLTGPNQKKVGSISDDIRGPWGLSFDASNSLYVANSANGTVTVYPYGSSTPSMTYSKGVREPLYALGDSAGHVFVSGRNPGSRNRGFVYEYNAGTNVPIASKRLDAEADGMAEDAHGNLYVAYRRTGPNCSIAEFGPGLTNERSLGMTINQPQGLLVDSSGNIVVVESALYTIDVFPPGSTTPSVTVTISGIGHLAELAMQNGDTTLWVSSENGYVYSMPYPLTKNTVPTEYESNEYGNGIAVSNPQ